jgi:SNF2 family DNA or RNA helicase
MIHPQSVAGGGPAPPGAPGLPTAPILVVCPTSLVTNWLRETARFTPHLRTLDLTGANRAEKFAHRHEHDLLVTSYAILRRDIEQYRTENFSLVILDEAQHIKNRGSQNAQSAKALRAQHRLILTGTPLENSVLDLWSLFDFLLPGYLGTASEFKDRYEMPLAKAPDAKLMERLRHRVRPFFLRRTKEEVLTELPPKMEFPTLCELTDEQREVYRAVLAQGRRDVFEHLDKAGRKSGRDRLAVLTTLLRLRQVCCHLDLLPGSRRPPGDGLGDAAPSPGGRRLPTDAETPRVWKQPSAKMDRTFELIDEAIDGGHRVLLFSQFVRVLHLLRDEAQRREIRFCYLDGQTTERQVEVDRFQNDAGIPLFFISLKAGGTGLNLTGADTVIHFDPWWNPAVEEQATSRAHRMGQSRSVQAYKLIAAGTVEEKIQALQARKRELFQASLASDEAFVDKLTSDDLEELLAE